MSKPTTPAATPGKGQHTPGPWHVSSTGNHQGLVISDAGVNVAVTYDKADAPLIASAPDLAAESARLREALTDCERALTGYKNQCTEDEWPQYSDFAAALIKARAALAAAERGSK